MKATGCLPLLKGILTVQFHLFRVTLGMEVKSQRTLFPELFYYGMVQCGLETTLYSCITAGKHVFVHLGLVLYGKKKIFSPVKAGKFQPKTFQKNTPVHISLHYKNNFSQLF